MSGRAAWHRPVRAVAVRAAIWGAFVVFGLVAVARTGLTQGAVGGTFATAQAIVQRETVVIDGNTAMIGPLDGRTPGIAYYGDRYYAAQPLGAALLGVPAAWVGIPLADALGRPDAAVLLVGVQGVLLLMLAAAAMTWAGERLGLPPPLALLAAALGAGAFLFPVGALTNAVALVAIVAVLLAIVLTDGADARVEAGWTPHGRLAMAGLLLGLLPFVVAFGWVASVCVAVTLVVQGGRAWWRRVGWVALGAAGPASLFLLINTASFGRPWAEAWWFTLGDGWQRTFAGRFLDTPLTALAENGRALGALALRHPLLVVGWAGLVVGLWYVPWRARITTLVLLVALGVPALAERQGTGMAAEERPVAALAPFALAGFCLLVALVARERPALVPWCVGGGGALIAAGAAVSVVGEGAARPQIVAIGADPAVFVAPVTLLTGVVVLLLIPPPRPPRVPRGRVVAMSGVTLLLLSGCGVAPAPARAPVVSEGVDLAPPLAVRLSASGVAPVWRLDGNARLTPDGGALTAANGDGVATAPVVPVQAGGGYRVAARVALAPGAPDGGTLRVQWLDRAQQPLGERVQALSGGAVRADVGALPRAAYARLVVAVRAGALVDEVRLFPRDGGRLDALPNYARAALSFSFDFETAMGGLIHTRGGTGRDVADAESRAMQMRAGAGFLRSLFAAYDVRGTFYANGYNFLTGNTARRQFVGNPTYARYGQRNGWPSDYWTTNPWYSDDPYGTEQTDPAWYFGTLTKQLAQDGNDIANHTFGHLFLHAGLTAEELDADLTEWDRVAQENGFPPARSFAFPWRASNSVTAEYYAVLAKHGITNVTRFYDYDPKTGPYTYFPVPAYPQLRVVPDYEMTNPQTDEAAALRGIEQTLAQGGVFSIWTHPESIAGPAAQAMWARVVAYAADRRSLGLWVAPVTTITDFADARDGLRLTSVAVGATTLITATNDGPNDVKGATLTLPRTPLRVSWTGGGGQRDTNGAQIRIGDLTPGARATIEVRYP